MMNMKALINSGSYRVMNLLRFHRGFSVKKDCVKGKVAIVTGAAQGLGKASSDILLKNGAKVFLADCNASRGHETLKELQSRYGKDRVLFNKCDVASMSQMRETFQTAKQKLGGLDIVINNAGTVGELGDTWKNTVDINMSGPICGTLLGIDHMRRDKGGRGGVIVNVSSLAGILPSPLGQVTPTPLGPVYSATQSGVIMFSQCWARNPDVVKNGIRVNVLAPGLIDTPLLNALKDPSINSLAELAPETIRHVGLMSPSEVAKEMMELVCDEGKNGAIMKLAKNSGKHYHTLE